MDISLGFGVLLVVLGFLAGIINTLAGGGSNLTIPALIVLGMPAEVANATNRVGVLMQSVSGIAGFRHHDRLETSDLVGILIPMLGGGLVGASAAAWLPSDIIKPLLLGTMLLMAFIMLIKPSVIAPDPDVPFRKVKDTPVSWIGLTVAGFYGGFVQAGVGFVLIAALCGTLRYDLVRGNALKLVCTLAFTSVSLVIFIWQDLILWLPGLLLALGSMVGAWLAVKFAIKASPQVLKWFLFIMTLVGCVFAYLT
ncbi:sulfite exporter TauE/SafE family protein [Enterovibrio sp. ZSDZ35]|uniref:Probable membrane transporter protein n=1 Tax=Enterovibrio qingdaonensis TaxID=2899818 RepID=A0ABT5QKX4_9GAMM|nr:sulfite exporter TauE/SafE family protein [Enterovibrio sp. ZSDZ35]MDD1781323.1 sulfite exporter TauE/SafE family protein [Enterovibrio sp. ZSDZ35]